MPIRSIPCLINKLTNSNLSLLDLQAISAAKPFKCDDAGLPPTF